MTKLTQVFLDCLDMRSVNNMLNTLRTKKQNPRTSSNPKRLKKTRKYPKDVIDGPFTDREGRTLYLCISSRKKNAQRRLPKFDDDSTNSCFTDDDIIILD